MAGSRVSNLTRGFRALRHPNYRLYWSGQSISLIGTWMQQVAQSWLVLELTGSAIDLGFVAALQTLPVLFVSAFGGLLADRVRKRDLMVGTQTVQMLLALTLGTLVATHHVQIWHVYVLAALLGLSNAFDMPTRQSFMIEMVGRDDLMSAVAMQSMQFNTARIVGPALAGLLIAAIGVTASFFANALSFVPVIIGLLAMRPDRFYQTAAVEHAPVAESLRQGWRYIWRTPAVLMIVLLVGTLGLFNNNISVLVPLFAKNVLTVGPQGYGMLMAFMGAGSLCGAIIASFSQRARWRTLFLGAYAFFAMQLCFALSRVFPLSLVFMALSGFSIILFYTSANTGVQTRVPDVLRGRVMGVYMAVNVGTSPLGNLAVGWVAEHYSAPVALIAGCLIALCVLVAASIWLLPRREQPNLSLDHSENRSDIQRERALAEAAG
jgi:MFS family permease